MHRDLTEPEIDTVLTEQLYGHLGCTLPDGRVYIVPITFAYHDGVVYSFSNPGQKIDALQQNPSVCFQVERFVSDGIWESVIMWGTYQELAHNERALGLKALFSRLEKEEGLALSPLYQPPVKVLKAGIPESTDNAGVLFCINVTQKTGRHVKYD